MTRSPCPLEDEVAVAARSGSWSPELRAHLGGCLTCAELTLVAAALASDAEALAADPHPLPDPRSIWLRARLADRRHVLDRATRSIVWVQRITWLVAAAIGLAFAPNLWSLLQGAWSKVDLMSPVAELPRAAGSPLLVLVSSLTILGLLALYEMTAARDS